MYTRMLLHTVAFPHTHTLFHTQDLLGIENFPRHTSAFTHKHFYTQELFRHSSFCTDTNAQRLYTQTLYNRSFAQTLFAQTLLQTEAFTHRHLYTQKFYTKTLLHTDTFTQSTQKRPSRRSFTQALLHRCFYTQEILAHSTQKFSTHRKIAIFTQLWRSTFISCQRVATGTRK